LCPTAIQATNTRNQFAQVPKYHLINTNKAKELSIQKVPQRWQIKTKKLISSHCEDSPFGRALIIFDYGWPLLLLGCVYHGAIKLVKPGQSLGLSHFPSSYGDVLSPLFV